MNYNLSGRNLIIVELFVKVELSMKALKGDACSIIYKYGTCVRHENSRRHHRHACGTI